MRALPLETAGTHNCKGLDAETRREGKLGSHLSETDPGRGLEF